MNINANDNYYQLQIFRFYNLLSSNDAARGRDAPVPSCSAHITMENKHDKY